MIPWRRVNVNCDVQSINLGDEKVKKISAIVLLALSLSACNSGNTPGTNSNGGQPSATVDASSPTGTATAVLRLLEKGEVQDAKKLFTTEMKGHNFAAAKAMELTQSGIKTLTVDVKSAKGEVAYVVATYEKNDGTTRQTMFDMLRENGEWHVSGVH
jgi:hypothetical protein